MSTEVNKNFCTDSAEITSDSNINLNVKIHSIYTCRLKKKKNPVFTIHQFPTKKSCVLCILLARHFNKRALLISEVHKMSQRELQAKHNQSGSPPSTTNPFQRCENFRGKPRAPNREHYTFVQFKHCPGLLRFRSCSK